VGQAEHAREVIAVLAIIVNTSLVSDKVTARQLDTACADSSPKGIETCKAFIVSGANTLLDPKGSFRQICAAPTASYSQFRAVFDGYLKVHPDEADRPAVIVILEAFEQAFPC
jgi:hypothetical protein